MLTHIHTNLSRDKALIFEYLCFLAFHLQLMYGVFPAISETSWEEFSLLPSEFSQCVHVLYPFWQKKIEKVDNHR